MQFKNVNFPAGYLWAFSLPATLFYFSSLCLSPSRPAPRSPSNTASFSRFSPLLNFRGQGRGRERKFDDSTAQLKFNARRYVVAYNSCATAPLIHRILRNEMDYTSGPRLKIIFPFIRIFPFCRDTQSYTVV